MSLVPSSPFGKTSRRVSMRTISQSMKSIAGWYGTPAHDANRSSRAPQAALLSEIGDVRARFPNEEALAALAGVAPVTRASGKLHSVGFRWACDKKLRNAVIDVADDSRHASHGPPTSTPMRSPGPADTPTRCASWPAPGSA
jgi:hypothetical protein